MIIFHFAHTRQNIFILLKQLYNSVPYSFPAVKWYGSENYESGFYKETVSCKSLPNVLRFMAICMHEVSIQKGVSMMAVDNLDPTGHQDICKHHDDLHHSVSAQ